MANKMSWRSLALLSIELFLACGLIALVTLTRVYKSFFPANFTALGAAILILGSRYRAFTGVFLVFGLQFGTDYLIHLKYGYPFLYGLVQWIDAGCFLTYFLLAAILVRSNYAKATWKFPVFAGLSTIVGAAVFFVVSNFFVWLSPFSEYLMYQHTLSGLISCYTAAIPFFFNTLAGDAAFAALLFSSFASVDMILVPKLNSPTTESVRLSTGYHTDVLQSLSEETLLLAPKTSSVNAEEPEQQSFKEKVFDLVEKALEHIRGSSKDATEESLSTTARLPLSYEQFLLSNTKRALVNSETCSDKTMEGAVEDTAEQVEDEATQEEEEDGEGGGGWKWKLTAPLSFERRHIVCMVMACIMVSTTASLIREAGGGGGQVQFSVAFSSSNLQTFTTDLSSIDSHTNVFDVLKATRDNSTANFTFTSSHDPSLGDFITSIQGVKGPGYWLLFCGHSSQMSNCGVDTSIVVPGAFFEWKLGQSYQGSSYHHQSRRSCPEVCGAPAA